MPTTIQECWNSAVTHRMRFPELYGRLLQVNRILQCQTALYRLQCQCSRHLQEKSTRTIRARAEVVRNIRNAVEEDNFRIKKYKKDPTHYRAGSFLVMVKVFRLYLRLCWYQTGQLSHHARFRSYPPYKPSLRRTAVRFPHLLSQRRSAYL